MDGPRDSHTDWSQSEIEEISYDIPYMRNLKRNNPSLFTKQEQTHRLGEWTMTVRGEGEGWEEGRVREFGMDM